MRLASSACAMSVVWTSAAESAAPPSSCSFSAKWTLLPECWCESRLVRRSTLLGDALRERLKEEEVEEERGEEAESDERDLGW